jgi:hypothetical protein
VPPPNLLHRVNKTVVNVEGSTHFVALCDGALFAIKHADGSNAMFPEFVDETIPPQDVPVFVRHGRKVEPLCDKSSIAEKEPMRRGQRGRNALCNHIARVLLERDLRRLGSCVITRGLLR